MSNLAESEARVWAQWARRYRLPAAATRALLQAIRNGSEADAYPVAGRVCVFVHVGGTLLDAVLATRLEATGFVHDEETGAWMLHT